MVLVDLSLHRARGSAKVSATVFSSAGTGTDECSKAYRLMAPRLLEILGQEPSVEVMSPGIDRTFRSEREWSIFTGKAVRVLLRDGGDWVRGRIAGVEGGRVKLESPGGARVLELSSVVKARLDSTQEGD